jgi:hypothetical protein
VEVLPHYLGEVRLVVEPDDLHLLGADDDVVHGEEEPALVDDEARAHALGAEDLRGRMLARDARTDVEGRAQRAREEADVRVHWEGTLIGRPPGRK